MYRRDIARKAYIHRLIKITVCVFMRIYDCAQ